MAIPAHFINVFQRPKQGTNFLKRHLVYNYQHSIVNQGWFDTASCDIVVGSDVEGQQILEQYLGTFVQIYVDNPCQPIWEGLINRIIFNSGGASYTISLDEMSNRLSLVYTAAVNVTTQTAVVNATVSQGIYGIKQGQFEFGPDPSAGTHRTNLQATIIAQLAFPQVSVTQGQGQSNLVHFELLGIYHTLEWGKIFTGTGTTTTSFTTKVGQVLTAQPNGATFFDNTDSSKVGTNAITIADQQRGQSYWELLLKIAESGDGTNYWVVGITPTDFNTKTRILYYQQANSAIEYTARQADGLRVRNLYGKYIRPWAVVPDRGIQVTDTLVGFGSSAGSDPRQMYIQGIQYDANSQKVTWLGADDTTSRAAFMLKHGYKPISRAFGAPLRTIVT